MRFFSGAGGIIRPRRRYLLTRRSCNPKKSLNRRIELNCLALNFGMLVCVVTLLIVRRKQKTSQIHIESQGLMNHFNNLLLLKLKYCGKDVRVHLLVR